MSAIRRADKAGSWYAGDAAGLAAEVDECVRKARTAYGPALEAAAGEPVAIVAPHAGLFFSGAVAAAGFCLVRERLGEVDTFVVFGACHRARLRRPALWVRGAWQTPLGNIDIDEELAAAFLDAGLGYEDERSHEGDNAIELQTPFIKHLFPGAKIVPAAMGFFPDSGEIGKKAAAVAAERGGRTVAVASTDLTHYGASFGVTPAGTGKPALDWIRANDMRFIKAVTALDCAGIVSVAERDGSACGAGAAAAAAGWAAARGCRGGTLLARTDSYEVMPRGEAEHMVGYASIAFGAAS